MDATLEGSSGHSAMALVEVGTSSSGGREAGSSGKGRMAVGGSAALFPATALARALDGAHRALGNRALDENGMSKSDLSAYHDLLEMTASMTGKCIGYMCYVSCCLMIHFDA